MAERRMFAKTIVLSDAFLDMPMSARCFYFTLGMFADDDGFVNNPKAIMRQCGASIDDMNVLIAKKFVIVFQDGVIVIKHWRINNYLRNDRYTQTKYAEDKSMLSLDENGAYRLESDDGIPSIGIPDSGIPSIGKDRLVEDRLDKGSIGEEKENTISNEIVKKKKNFVPPTLEEVEDFCYENNLSIDPAQFIDFYETNGWMVGRNHMKDWKAAARNWDRRRKAEPKQKAYSGGGKNARAAEDMYNGFDMIDSLVARMENSNDIG